MHQKVLIGTLLGIFCILFVFGAGCSSTKEGTPVPTAPTSEATATQTVVETPVTTLSTSTKVIATEMLQSNTTLLDRDGTSASDAAFNIFFVKSTDEIVNKTTSVVQAMVPGSLSVQAVYSPAILYLEAKDLGHTIERDYDLTLNMKTNTPETEEKRIAYLHFLYMAKSGANHIADAAEAESFGDYSTALAMATAARTDLRNVKVDPDLPPTVPFNTLNIFLTEYIGRVQEKVIQQQNEQTNQRPQSEARFPR
jgi:hypothetical protein